MNVTQTFPRGLRLSLFTIFTAIAAFSFGLRSADADVPVGGAYLVGWRGDTPDGISVAIFEDMNIGDQLFFTDAGFFASGNFRGNEGVMSWTATSDMTAGTVVNIINSSAPDANADEGTALGKLSLSGGGDQIFVGNSPFPTTNNSFYDHNDLVFGLDYNGAAGWDPESVSTSTSALPSALSIHNIAFAHFDNGVYVGPRSGLTVSQFQEAIRDESNWELSNALGGTQLDSTDFQIVPEPTSLGVLGLIGIVGMVRRRR